MATYSRPGVYIQEVALPQVVPLANVSQSVGAIAGWLNKGSTAAPVLVSSWSDFVKNFGGLNDSYPTTWAAYNFYANGGRQLYVQRLAGTGAVTGTISFNDNTGVTTTATVTAASAASGTVTYTASNGFAAGQTVTITGITGTTAFNLTGVTIATANATTFTVTNAATGTAVTGQTATATVVTASNPVFTLTAVNPGAWINSYAAQIIPGGSPSTFGLNIFAVSGTSYTAVESYTDLSMSSTDKNFVRTVINTLSAVATIGTVGFDGTKTPFKTATTPTTFTGGADGTAPVRTDYYNPATTPHTGAWAKFDVINNPVIIYAADAPYQATATLTSQLHGDAMIYAATRDDAFTIVDTSAGLSATAAQAEVTATLAIAGASTTGNISAAYFPWINIPDGNKIAGAVRLQAPGAAVVGQYLATDATRGVFKTPAGLGNQIALAVSTERAFTNAELDALNTSVDPINAIRQVPGAGIVIMGGRTLDNTSNNRYINIRRSLYFIEKQMKDLSSFALFESNDSRLWSQLRTTLNSFLLNYWQQGGLRGTSPQDAYYVKVDETTTTFADMQNGRVNIEVGVALQYPAEFVVIKLGQLTGSATA
jgi:phage tail sheath protein FI